MKSNSKAYKYGCRKCSIRQRCVDEKSISPTLKRTIIERFANRTDTFETWDVLQQDCLRIRNDSQRAARQTTTAGSLSERLRRANQQAQQPSLVKPKREPFPTRPKPTQSGTWASPQAQASIKRPPRERVAQATFTNCGLTVPATQRLVRLPDDGEMVLGRFEHGFSNPPDVDLAFDDGEIPSVSRRHAILLGRGGEHWLMDMGSSNGTYVNGHPVPLSKGVQLTEGDRILVGRCRLVYAPLPDWVLDPDPKEPHTVSILITHTGKKIHIDDGSEIVIGRPDASLGYAPDVDLSVAGDIATSVSRRHVRLVKRDGLHFLEELGGAAGTRVNGSPIHSGAPPLLLHHGDQIWLGGCVLAYEWQLTQGVSN